MAWRPSDNLIDGELDNRTSSGKVTGWIRFFRRGKKPLKVSLDLDGDFHKDIRGKVIRLKNSVPVDANVDLCRDGTYMDGFARLQTGNVGDITVKDYPYIEWYSGTNGRTVLELDASQVKIL